MERQLQLHRQIGRFLDNFKKIGRNNYTPAIVRSRIHSLKELWLRFNDEHVVLERTVSDATKLSVSYFSENIYDKTEDMYNVALDHLAEVLEDVEPPPSPNRSVDISYTRSHPSAFVSSHLPVIQLPPFDGNEAEWEPFRDKFTAVIIDNRELHDFARMHYLVSFLRGRALECLSGLAISADNFNVAWQTLKSRYDNKRRLISVHMSSLLNLSRLNRESAHDLQSLRSKVRSILASLANLQRTSADSWNDFLVHIVLLHLDPTTRRAWTLRATDNSEPHTYDDLDRFLSERVRALEDLARDATRTQTMRSNAAPRVHNTNITSASRPACPICNSRHFFSSCSRFLSGNLSQRRDLVLKHRRCFNCLSPKHDVNDCSSRFSCRICYKRHHSLLHDSSASHHLDKVDAPLRDTTQVDARNVDSNTLVAATQANRRVAVLLATARVRVHSTNGRSAVVRALLDQGSEVTLASERLVQVLKAKHLRASTSIRAVGCVSAGTVRCAVELGISSLSSSSPSFITTAMVLKALTSYAPRQFIELNDYQHLSGLTWADPNPFDNEPIDLIIGSDLYAELLCEGVRKGSVGQPIAQQTAFGWVVSGPIGKSGANSPSSLHLIENDLPQNIASSFHCLESLDNELKRFWEVENVPCSSIRTPEDEQCENHFTSTHSRTPEGRYRVRLPFKRNTPINIGSSRWRAERSLKALFRRFQNQERHQNAYNDFLREYHTLGHMRRANDSPEFRNLVVYLPHHPVFRSHSFTSGVRVVFNASSPTSNGTSLNDYLLAGPKLQSDLSAVISRWRNFRFVYCADITKMYRQILLDERDVDFQRILWCESQDEPPIDFQLLTVTYGMACAPFLALRVIQQLNTDEGHNFPIASQILQNNIYVDDILFGGDSIKETLCARQQVVSLLGKGGFPLRKWSGNSQALLADIPEEEWGLACSRTLAGDERIRVLGVTWVPSEDVFRFGVSLPAQIPRSKRAILSTIARLYDPLGWVTPVVIAAKIFLQSLWRHKLSWDESISVDLFDHWQRIYQGLSVIDGIRVSRWTGFGADVKQIELHGFADASNAAYAAVVYCKITSVSNLVTVTLLTGKSKVAPIKPLSVPRLELCAAVILARLIEFTRSVLSFKEVPCFCWSDSKVVLTWLSQHPSKWKVFVAHRVSDIQNRVPDAQWRYVPTFDNPADCASRGLLGNNLKTHSLWWQGPPWLTKSEYEWPKNLIAPAKEASNDEKVVSLHVKNPTPIWEFFTRYSSWPKLIRVLAYICKFISACRQRTHLTSNPFSRSLAVTAAECSAARIFIIKALQQELFSSEIRLLAQRRPLPMKNSILSLSPFLDPDGILRVGGRLSRSPLPFPSRHPILLSSHRLTDLIIDHAHLRSLHSGLQLTLSVLRRDFWILRARSVVRHRIYKCIVCARERASMPTQQMSVLPRERVSAPSRSFTHTGVDYAGPVQVRDSSGRGRVARKAYIALFICLATRAIHLELVSDYSTRAFLNAFSRFSARRGLPHTIYSDNGTNFVGAEKELSIAYRAVIRDPVLLNDLAIEKVEWKFIPPSAPHFGGIWEAGVKSVKHHFRRIVKNHTLTIEEMSTLLCRIEACLNSRPIAPLSDILDDYEPLTPGHFLIGSALTMHPEPSVLDVSENRLSRWQLVHHMTERFWHYWYYDYVNLLQQRSKWRQVKPPLKVGQLVLIRNNNTPPCKWELGRISQCHPSADGLVRVATVKTASSEFVRPLVKLCILPVDSALPSNCVTSADSL